MTSSESELQKLYPLMLDLADRRCLVVGGGKVACRKLKGLLTAGARVTLVAPDCLAPPIDDNYEWLRRTWLPEDLAGAVLVLAATDDPDVNQAVAQAAGAAGIPVNLATGGGGGDVHLPAVRRVGGFTLAVATGGKSPALSAVVADLLADHLGGEWAFILELATALRERALTGCKPEEYNQSILRRLLEEGLERFVAQGRGDDIDRLLQRFCGMDCSLQTLGLELPGKTS